MHLVASIQTRKVGIWCINFRSRSRGLGNKTASLKIVSTTAAAFTNGAQAMYHCLWQAKRVILMVSHQVIALSGPRACGKSTIATYLVNKWIHTYCLRRLLRDIAAIADSDLTHDRLYLARLERSCVNTCLIFSYRW